MGSIAGSIIDSSPELTFAATPHPPRIAIKEKGKIHLVDPSHVVAVKAEGHYVLLQLNSGSRILRGSISMMARKLGPHGFVRIHRSFLVNAVFVQEIQALPTGEYVLRVRTGQEYTVSRTYKKNLQDLAESWIGIEGFAAD